MIFVFVLFYSLTLQLHNNAHAVISKKNKPLSSFFFDLLRILLTINL